MTASQHTNAASLAAAVLLLVIVALPASSCSSCSVPGEAQEAEWVQAAQLLLVKPAARAYHCAAYDAVTRRMIVFGGGLLAVSGTLPEASSETWTYDPATDQWSNPKPQGMFPAARVDAAMAADTSSGKLILFGGLQPLESQAAQPLTDTWMYDPVANIWTELRPEGQHPPSQGGQSVIFDPSTNKLFLFTSDWDSIAGDFAIFVWAYDLAGNTWTQVATSGSRPSARIDQAVAYDSRNSRIVMFGGSKLPPILDERPFLNDLWAFDTTDGSWTELRPDGSIPPASLGPVAWYDPIKGDVVLFVGWLWGKGGASETWAFDSDKNTWRKVHAPAKPPGPRVGESVVMVDSLTGKAVLFGGAGGPNQAGGDQASLSTLYGDVWWFRY